jgi:hypothetical protein
LQFVVVVVDVVVDVVVVTCTLCSFKKIPQERLKSPPGVKRRQEEGTSFLLLPHSSQKVSSLSRRA